MIRTVQKTTVLALLVEANGLVRLKLNRALEREHFEVLWTATTQEAVVAYNRRHIDLLLLDLNQPLKVGWEIFEPVGALNPALPIVMVAEKETELEQSVAERVGARLEKPFSLRALIQTIHLLLGQPQTHLQATGSGPTFNHSTSSQPAPPWRARQETGRKQTYGTKNQEVDFRHVPARQRRFSRPAAPAILLDSANPLPPSRWGINE